MCSHVNRHMCVGEYRQRLISRVFFDQSYPLFTEAVRSLAEPISLAVLAGSLPWEFALSFPSVGITANHHYSQRLHGHWESEHQPWCVE